MTGIRRRRVASAAALIALIAGCGGDTADEPPAPVAPVIVYAAHADETYWPGVFAAYTQATGTPVSVRHGAADNIVDDVIANRGRPPADLLLTPSVAGVWRAADEGALRPFLSDRLRERLPQTLRDPDDTWIAVDLRLAAIAYDANAVDTSSLSDFAALAEPTLHGRLCLTSSTLPVNQVVIAALIQDLGTRPAELAVRGWLDNLAQPVFASENALREALLDGRCGAGIVSVAAGGEPSLATTVPEPAIADVQAAGIARHAADAEAARALLEWLIDARADGPLDVSVPLRPVGSLAWRVDDANRLAERAGYR